jgi:hypothetical protein
MKARIFLLREGPPATDRQLTDYCGSDHKCAFEEIRFSKGRGRGHTVKISSKDADQLADIFEGGLCRTHTVVRLRKKGKKTFIRCELTESHGLYEIRSGRYTYVRYEAQRASFVDERPTKKRPEPLTVDLHLRLKVVPGEQPDLTVELTRSFVEQHVRQLFAGREDFFAVQSCTAEACHE